MIEISRHEKLGQNLITVTSELDQLEQLVEFRSILSMRHVMRRVQLWDNEGHEPQRE